MKNLKKITTTIETLKPQLCKRYGVKTIGVFGSYTRGEQTKKSDVDILVTFREDDYPGLFKFMELEEFLSEKLDVKVDLVSEKALKPYIGKRILEEVVML